MSFNRSKLNAEELAEVKELLARKEQLERSEKVSAHFLDFVKEVWPDFVSGNHHKIMAKRFEAVLAGKCKRLIINMPPRHTKSEFASFLLPAWLLGRDPNKKIIQATHTTELALRFGRKVRDLINSEEYASLFPETKLRSDAQSAGRWLVEGGGEYFACGVGSALAGRGADLCIIDDPHSEQDAFSPDALEDVWEWYQAGPRQRLQPGGAIVIVMTRWSVQDLTARLLKQQETSEGADKWEVIEFPCIFDEHEEKERPLWPEYWSLEELRRTRASMGISKWQAQYQQQPTSDTSAIIKRDWWRVWESNIPPQIEYCIQSYDTAYGEKEVSDYSAITTWGIFYPQGPDGPPAIILMDAVRGRWEFPELRKIAVESYKHHKPDTVLIENKASGLSLAQELRRTGIPVITFNPGGRRGSGPAKDKTSRTHAVAPLFESGMVYAPQTRFADEVIEECASFPVGEHDDYLDTVTQAMLRFREGGFVQHPQDYAVDWRKDDDEDSRAPRKRVYYA